MHWPVAAGYFILAYLVGAVPTAYFIARLVKGIDLRQYGSGNVGGTNLVRQVGKPWLAPLIAVDVLVKGAGPALAGRYILGLDLASPWLLGASLAAIAGHNWPVYLGFQGGRGIAVALGALLVLSPVLLGAFVAVFGAGWLLTRSSAVWVLAGLAVLPGLALAVGLPNSLAWYLAGVLALVALKRLLGNGGPFPQDLSRAKVLFNRLFRDRDMDRGEDWIDRRPPTETY
ncbi:MAG: acyl-phosphate glycerol 3-phosphate acyltransferase [SAR202 cluster bacterium]|nr:acyl-phosphate glycerol 3-phosphate acyltransferase [SAR202 cluster bacterium]